MLTMAVGSGRVIKATSKSYRLNLTKMAFASTTRSRGIQGFFDCLRSHQHIYIYLAAVDSITD